MILFVFEGKRREPELFKTIEFLFFPAKNNSIICSYCNNIYSLYKEMSASDFEEDIVTILKQKSAKDLTNPLTKIKTRDNIAEVFLFFDYDCHNQNRQKSLTMNTLNAQIQELIEYFSDETDHGKLYINYPMVESIRYTKKLPDNDFLSYTVSIEDCQNFKQRVATFSHYQNLDFISFHSKKARSIVIPSK